MSFLNILLIHLGDGPLPNHMEAAFYNLSLLKSPSRIILIANEHNRKQFTSIKKRLANSFINDLQFVPAESVPDSPTTTEFRQGTKLNKKFRNGFWFQASNRFYVLADYMMATQLENCLHIETDVVLYFDPGAKLAEFQAFADFAVPLDRVRAIPGVVWFKNSRVARRLTEHMLRQKHMDDMATLGEFCLSNPDVAKPLPSVPLAYAISHNLDQVKYCQGLELFDGIFDCAAIGQYVGGIHWLNDPEDTRFFLNESSDLNVSQLNFSWKYNETGRVPQLRWEAISTKVLSIHAHSKDLMGIAMSNTGIQTTQSEVVSGERIQALADLTVSTKEITKFHKKLEVPSQNILEIPFSFSRHTLFTGSKKLEVPTEVFIDKFSDINTVFIYTHLIPYFKKYVAPRLKSKFVLITHNSDNPVTLSDLDLLNHPNLIKWFAQNAELSHTKLCGIPIGVANKQWGAEKIDQLMKASRTVDKTKMIYANFSESTHPSRVTAREALTGVAGITIEQGVSFEQYVKQLAAHKFCICPRGNGIDTHRFWEAQYLDCIPIILRQDWTEAYSGLPVVILDDWQELDVAKLQSSYIQISTTSFDRRTLRLSHFKAILDQCLKYEC
jgi:hypothetical protein